MTERATTQVGGAELDVQDVVAREAMSELFSVDVRCDLAPEVDPPAVEGLIGGAASVTLDDGFGGRRTIAGVVTAARHRHHDDGSTTFEYTLRPPAFLLTLGRNCRAFQDMTVVDIVTQVLGGVPHRWEVGGSFAVRPYTVQYREDDWSFACRLLESEGIFYWFDHEAGSQLVLGDASPSAPELSGGATIAYHLDTGMIPDQEIIEALGGMARVGPTSFSVKSFNPKNPTLAVSGSTGGGGIEVYDAPGGGPTDPAAAAAQAQRMAGAAAVAAAGVGGRSNCARLCAGRVVEIVGHPAGLDGRYFLTEVRAEVHQRRHGAEQEVERAFDVTFSGIAASTPFVPPTKTPPAQQAGIQAGVVGGVGGAEIYPNDAGEVRVQQHWDRKGSRDERSGTWMRVAQRGTHDSLQLPRMGWNVLTFNEEGAVDAPSVLARVNDGEHPPAYPLPANKTRVVFKTQTSPADGTFNEVYFEDQQGSEEMFIHASRDMNVLVQRAKVEAVEHDSLRTVGRDHHLMVVDQHLEKITRDQTVDVGGDELVDVGSTYREGIERNLTLRIGGSRKLEVGGDAAWATKHHHDLSVAALRLDTCLGDIGADAGKLFTELVGGAQIKLAAQSITESCGGVSFQTIGGAKLEFSQASRPLDVKRWLFETVGGLVMLKTDGNYVDAATKSSAWTVGGKHDVTSTKSVLVQASEKIELVCGGSSIVIEPETITVKAPKLALADADLLEIETQTIEHN